MIAHQRGIAINQPSTTSLSLRRGSSEMTDVRTGLRGAAWLFYAIFVLEILFMISPAALYFYSVYGPALNFLDASPATAWLTQFFLPHISTTASPVLNGLGELGWL